MAVSQSLSILPKNRILKLAIVDNIKRPKNDTPTPRAKKVSWALPYTCKAKRGSILIGNTLVATRCGSRGCLSCHRKKLRNFVAPAMELASMPEEKLYSLVITPKVGRVYTQEDVDGFLKSVRVLLNKWRRYYGLGHAYWVAECVVKWDEVYSNIRCPVLESVENGLSDIDRTMKDCHIQSKEAVRGIVEQCLKGDNCPMCRGRGYLPSVRS